MFIVIELPGQHWNSNPSVLADLHATKEVYKTKSTIINEDAVNLVFSTVVGCAADVPSDQYFVHKYCVYLQIVQKLFVHAGVVYKQIADAKKRFARSAYLGAMPNA